MNRSSFALGLALLACLAACSPKPELPPSQSIKPSQSSQPIKVQVGSIQISQPQDAASFAKLRDTELVTAVRNKQMTPDQARTFLKAQKRRLGLPNPDFTRGFDQILRQQGLDH